jgi:CDP-diacylglycerol--glycerol-3-phosphate 3-phosphatidyltransferase
VNLANAITLSRFPILFVIVLLLYAPFPGSRMTAFLLYLVSGFSDWLDGYVARRSGSVSNFGKFMDALSDKILVLGLFAALLTLKIVPSYYLFPVLLILGREFFVTGIRLVAISRNIVIAAEKSGKIKTIFQMVSVGSFICSEAITFDFKLICPNTWLVCAPYLSAAFYYFGYTLFVIATVCAVESGIRYTIKYRWLFSVS